MKPTQLGSAGHTMPLPLLQQLLLLGLGLLLLHAPAPAHAVDHIICLNFPAQTAGGGGRPSDISLLAACSRIIPSLQALGITWTQSYCSYVPPPLSLGPPLPSATLQAYTCTNTSLINRFSGPITTLWSAAFPFVSTRLRQQLQDSFRTLPTIGLLVSTPSTRLPVGLAGARGQWTVLVADDASIANPPPPMGSGSHFYPPPAPPVPPRQECRAYGGGDPLRVEGLVLCVQPSYDNLQYDDRTCRMNLTMTLTSVGSNIIPERGLGSSFSLMLGSAQLMGWSRGRFNVTRASASVAVKGVGLGIGPAPPGQHQTVPLTFSISCNSSGTLTAGTLGLPPACACASNVMIQPPAGGVTDAPCTALSSSVNGSAQCFSVPQPPAAPPTDLGHSADTSPAPGGAGGSRLRRIMTRPTARRAAASAPQCSFKVHFTVTNLGASAVPSIPGPLQVDLGAAQGRLVLGLVDSNSSGVTCDSGPRAQSFSISSFGSLMQPGQSSNFTLNFTYAGPCSEVAASWADLMQLIIFMQGTQDPVTSVQSSSETAGSHQTSPAEAYLSFNDQVNVDPSSTCIFPQTILMDYTRGTNTARPTSYLYVHYPAQVDNLPVLHGKLPPGFYDNSSGFSSAQLFSVPRGQTSTGSIGDSRIIKIVAYVMNISGSGPQEDFVCGMDLWVVPRAQVYTGAQIFSPQYKLGCSPRNDLFLVPVVRAVQFAAPPPNAFFGWFAGTESADRVRLMNLQAMWVACTGDEPDPGSSPSPEA